jgi:glucose-6-phosphate isomerase
MSLKFINPTETIAWKKLHEHYNEVHQNVSIKDMFASDSKRTEKFHIKWNAFLLDYSKNKINPDTITLLLELAHEMGLENAINHYFKGEKINVTENRAVLHTALRAKRENQIFVDGENIVPEIFSVKENIKTFTSKIITGSQNGFTNKPFTDVVNIGIGGSDLGPAMVVEALQFYKNHLNIRCFKNIYNTRNNIKCPNNKKMVFKNG